MIENIIRAIPNGKHKATIEYFANPSKKFDTGNQEQYQTLSLQYYIDKVTIDNIFSEELKDDYIYIIFRLKDGTLFEPLPIRNGFKKGSVLREYFESLNYNKIKEMKEIDDDTYIKSKLIIETKKVSRKYPAKERRDKNIKKQTYQISKIISMVDSD